jgi:hypothetical protein
MFDDVDPLVDNTSLGFFVSSLSSPPSHFLVDVLFHVFFFFEQQRATFRETRRKAEESR